MPSSLNPTRRSVMLGLAAAGAGLSLPLPARAQNVDAATALVGQLMGELNPLINSGRSEAQLYQEFEGLLDRYADMPIIAQSVMGVEWRSASGGQRRRFTSTFRSYVARKYGSRFRELIGGEIEVTGGRAIRNFVEVTSIARLRGEAPFEVVWLVSDGSGRNRFFNLVIEGINLVITERQEIGSLLDRNGGDVDAMISDLGNLG